MCRQLADAPGTARRGNSMERHSKDAVAPLALSIGASADRGVVFGARSAAHQLFITVILTGLVASLLGTSCRRQGSSSGDIPRVDFAIDETRYPKVMDAASRTPIQQADAPGLWEEMERIRIVLGLPGRVSAVESLGNSTYALWTVSKSEGDCNRHKIATMVKDPDRWIVVGWTELLE